MENKKVVFIGRKKELNYLNSLEKKKSASFVVIKGRRRVGKSRLVQEFGKDKGLVRFSGLPPEPGLTPIDQRAYFASQLSEQLGAALPDSSDWSYLFDALGKTLKKENRVVLFDEISWMSQGDATFMPKLKDFWDKTFSQKQQLIFVVCGSVSSWIEKNILSSTGFFGRISEKITLEPLSLEESFALLKALRFPGSLLEKIILLSITGGIPWYIELLGQSQSLSEAISRFCFRKDGILVQEYDRIFHDLFGSRNDTYKAIIQFLLGASKENSEIAKGIDFSRSGTLSEYLDDLTVSGFVARDTVWSIQTGKPRKILPYRLRDNYLRFYMKVIEPNLLRIEQGHFESQSYTQMKAFNAIIGLQFENLVLNNREMIYEALGINRLDIVADNPYLQRQTKRHPGCQIDLLIQTRLKNLYVCEIKFSQRTIGMSVVDEVKKKIKALNIPKDFAASPILIHIGELSEDLEFSEYFIRTIDVAEILRSRDQVL